MIFAQYSALIVKRAKAIMHCVLHASIGAALLYAGTGTATAGPYDGAMAKAEYTLVAGDVNGDGRVDFLVKSKPKLLMVPVGDDLSVPITLPAPSPTFMLRSNAGGTYSLVSNPSAQDLAFAWGATDYKLAPALPEAGGNDALSIFTTTAGKPTFLVAMSPATGALQLTRTVWLPPAGSPANAMLPSDYAVFSADINGDKQNDVLFKARSRIVLVPDPASDDEDDMIISIIKPRSTTFALVSSGYGKYTLVVHPLAEILDSPLWKPATQTIAFSGVNGIFTGAVTITPVDREQASFVVSMKGDTGELLITSSAPPAVDMNTPPPLITVKRTPYPLEAGKLFDLTWSTTDATSMTRTCTADGTGFRNAAMAVGANGTELAVRAKSEWISYPSTCTWTATGPGGTATFVETVNTKYVPLDGQPTITVSHLPVRFIVETEYALNLVVGNGGGGVSHNCSVGGQRVYLAIPGAETIGSGRHVAMVPAAWGGKTLQCTFYAKNLDGLVAETALSIPVDPIPPGGNIGQLTGNVAGVSIDGNGAASVHGYACFPKSTEALEVQVSVYDEALDFKVALIDGMTNIASSDAVAGWCNTVGTGAKHGWSIPLGQFQKQYAGKVIHVRGLSKIGEPVMLPNSGRYSIPTGNLSGYLTASHTQIVTGSNGTADVTLEGAGTNGGGNVQHVALVWDKGDGSAPVVVETLTPSGSPSSVPIKKTMALGVGQHRFTLRITDSNWTTKELSPWVSVSVLGSTVFGATNPVHQEGGTNYLSAWACENNRGDALSYKVFTDAPSLALGGKQIASGAGTFGAFVPTAANQEKCHTPGSGYSFKIDLDATRNPEDGPIAANTPLFVEVQTMSGAAVTLPSATGSAITMPTGVQIALATPANGDKVEAPGPVFISARVTGGVKPGEVVEFAIDNVWMPAKQDSDGSNLYYLLSPDNLVDLRFYAVRARVKNSTRVLAYSAISSFEVTAKAYVRVAVPPVDAKYTVGAAVTLSATTAGLAAPVATLKFYLDGRELVGGTSSNGKWTATWTPTAAGAYSITASAFDGEGKLLGTAPAAVYNVTAAGGSTTGPSSSTPIPILIDVPHTNNALAGTIPGALAVSPTGAAQYSMAIAVPPGTAGLVPNLSLNYSSDDVNGLFGLGFKLDGLSSIHRCGKTIAQDGVNGRVSFAKSDRLCLDGVRLVLVNLPLSDDNYWSNLAEYRTEIDSFSRVTVSKDQDSAVTGFKVERKDGRISLYGTSVDSAVKPIAPPIPMGTWTYDPGTKVGPLSWALSRTSDRAGNYVHFAYTQDQVSGEHKPSVIRYGAAGLAPHAAVVFTYDKRKDAWKRYVDDARTDLRSRTSHIETFIGDDLNGERSATWTPVRDYAFKYDYSPTSGRSLLSKVQVSARNPQTSVTEFLPATVFDWGKPDPSKEPGFESKGMWANAPVLTTNNFNVIARSYNHPEYFAFADFENHGRTDALEKRVASPAEPWSSDLDHINAANPIPAGTLRPSYRYFHNTGSGFSVHMYRLSTNEDFAVLDVGDFNGDGALDILASTAAGPKICISPLSRGLQNTASSPIVFACASSTERPALGENDATRMPFVIDVAGDGRAALYSRVLYTEQSATLCIQERCVQDNRPPVAVLPFEYHPYTHAEPPEQVHTAFTDMIDLNGAGKASDVRWTKTHLTTYVLEPDGTLVSIGRWENLQANLIVTNFRKPGDVEVEPVFTYGYPEYTPPCSTRDCLYEPYWFDSPLPGATVAGDFNGSGYSNLVYGFVQTAPTPGEPAYRYADRTEMTLCLSTGRALDCTVRKKYSGANYKAVRAVGDFVGDGQPAVLVENFFRPAGRLPVPTGNLEMCRIKGDDTTGGATEDDENIVCVPWVPLTMPKAPSTPISNAIDKLHFMDLLGTGRTQFVIYHAGKYEDGNTWKEDGRWEVFAPRDLAMDGQALDKIHKVTNGLGAVSVVEYVDGVTSGVVSSVGATNFAYPLRAVTSPGKVVGRLRQGNGVSPDLRTSYLYRDGGIDTSGRGSLGFREVVVLDEQSKLSTTTTHSQRWPFTGMVLTTTVTANNGQVISDSENALAFKDITHPNGAVTKFAYLSGGKVEQFDLYGKSTGKMVSTGNQGGAIEYDSYGNLLSIRKTITGSMLHPGASIISSEDLHYMAPDISSWIVSRVERSTQTSAQTSNGISITRTVELTYDPDHPMMVKSHTIEPGNDAFKLVKTYTRNKFGAVKKIVNRWQDPVTKLAREATEYVEFDTRSRFAVTRFNALGHKEEYSYDAATGIRTRLEDSNRLVTTWGVDGFGQVMTETRPDGNQTRTKLATCDQQCPVGAAVARITDTFSGVHRSAVPRIHYFDSVDHELRFGTWGYDGRAVVTDRTFDERGRLYEVFRPRYINEPAFLARRIEYDVLNRITAIYSPDEQGVHHATTFAYSGLETTRTDRRRYSTVEWKDAAGRVEKVVDARGKSTIFGYDPHGNLIQTIDPNKNVINVVYDKLGRRTKLIDPNLGEIRYEVDPLGRVWQKSSPEQRLKGGITTFVYDDLGRLRSRSEADLNSQWIYDIAPMGIGKLAEAFTGSQANPDYRRQYGYDSVGRKETENVFLFGDSYKVRNEFDNWGRLSAKIHTRGSSSASPNRFDIRYGAYGSVAHVRRGDLVLSDDRIQDSEGRVTEAKLGNGLTRKKIFNGHTSLLTETILKTDANDQRLEEGYQYDRLGNVTSRTQAWDRIGFQEGFTYDELSRLSTSQILGASPQAFTYDDGGNLTSKTGVGGGAAFIYEAVQPHAVSSIANVGKFEYDKNGNLVTGLSRSVTWSSFDRPLTISDENSSSAFVYGPEYQRTRQTRRDGSIVVYAGEQEIEKLADGQLKIKTYWPFGIGLEIEGIGPTPALFWTHTDRLGSIVAVTDQAGNLVARLAYDAWGKRRPLGSATTPERGVDNKGFTGHEMLDQLELVHMNGRIYDPLTSRFLSADPLVQDPQNGQGYNRYSYVFNNPVNLIDPSGFEALCNMDSGSCTVPGTINPQPYVFLGSTPGRAYAYQNLNVAKYGGGGKRLAPLIAVAALGTVKAVNGEIVRMASRPTDGYINQMLFLLSKFADLVQSTVNGDEGKNSSDAVSADGEGKSGTNSGDEKKAGESNVRDNNKKGTTAEDELASDLTNAGRDVDRQVRKETPFGPRIIDIEVKDQDGNVLGGIEVKAGESRYRADQRSKDEWLRQNGYPVDLVRKK